MSINQECAKCEGHFAYNEKIIEQRGERYCEVCYGEEHGKEDD